MAEGRIQLKPPRKPENIRHIVAVMSGKGGVGKTTVAVNLAAAFFRLGRRVSIFDADITGPNVVKALGAEGGQLTVFNDKIVPYKAHGGIGVVSMAFLVGEGEPIIWRGPLKIKAIQQLFDQTDWGYLDWLIIDLPPGTSDEPLSIMQDLSLDGVIIVTTPQRLALLDIERAINMVKRLDRRVLGIIENMSYFICPGDVKVQMFGGNWTDEVAMRTNVPVLGRLPFDPSAAWMTDEGKPFVLFKPESEMSAEMMRIAEKLEDMLEEKEGQK